MKVEHLVQVNLLTVTKRKTFIIQLFLFFKNKNNLKFVKKREYVPTFSKTRHSFFIDLDQDNDFRKITKKPAIERTALRGK